VVKESLSIFDESDQPLSLKKAAGAALWGGLLALGTVLPQSLALSGIAYAPVALLGVAINPLWMLWSAIACSATMLLLSRTKGAIYGVRSSSALLYASTLATCASQAHVLKLSAMGVMALAAACMSFSAAIIWVALRYKATSFVRYLPSPVGRGLQLGFGLTILWLQGKAVLGWFHDESWTFHAPTTALIGLVLLLVLLGIGLAWRRQHPSKPYLLALLPLAVLVVAGVEVATPLTFDWLATGVISRPIDLLPLYLPAEFSFGIMHGASWAVLAVLAVQALFVAFTVLVDSAGNAATLENLSGGSYDLNDELRASALSMAVMPWFGLVPASTTAMATRPLYDQGVHDGQSIRLANLVVLTGLLGMLALVWEGANRVPVLFVIAALVIIGVNLLDPVLFEHPGRSQGKRELWWQTWMIGLVFLFTSGVFAMVAGFAVAVAQLIRSAEANVVRSICTLKEIRSRRWRSNEEEALVLRAADRVVIMALQGTASFAVARRIREEISRIVDPSQMDVLLIDAQRVTHWDMTALEAFRCMADEFQRTNVELMLSNPSDDARSALAETVKLFASNDKALEWAENEVLRRQDVTGMLKVKMFSKVIELPVLSNLGSVARNDLVDFGQVVAVASGQAVFNVGDTDGSLLIILAGNVSIQAPGSRAGEPLRVATFGAGMVFGEMAFLDGSARSAKAFAVTTCMLFCLPRVNFASWAQHHPKDAQALLTMLATQLSLRLRTTTGQLIALGA
jgi:sulfate permease, SulP family